MNYVPPQRGFKTFAILVGLGIGTFAITQLGQAAVSTLSQASATDEPLHIRVTNLSPTEATLSWSTTTPTRGAIILVDPTGIEREEFTPHIRTNHHITVDQLLPNTTYQFVVQSGNTLYYNNKGEHYTFTTAFNVPRSEPLKVFGQVINLNNDPTPDTVVFVTMRDQDNEGSEGLSTTLSALTNSQGIFSLNLEQTLAPDLSTPFYYSRSEDRLEVTARGPAGEKASVLLTTAQAQPTPPIRLTPNGRLLDLTGQEAVKGQSIILHPEVKKEEEKQTLFEKLFMQ